MKKLLTFFAVVTLCLAMGGIARANLVVNGGFETGDLTGWTFIAATSGSNFTVGPPAYQGSYAAQFGARESGYYDIIEQHVTTVPGATYTFSFYLNQQGTSTPNEFSAFWGVPAILHLLDVGSFGYTLYSFSEVAPGSTTFIGFAGQDVSSYFGLDNVSVDPIPVPGAVWLLGSGLLGLLGLPRFRKG